MAEPTTFGIGIADIFKSGIEGYRNNLVPLSAAALLTIGVSAPFQYVGLQFDIETNTVESVGYRFLGVFLGSIAAHIWFRYALDAVDGKTVEVAKPFATPQRFLHQAVASFWFLAAVALGLRFFFFPAVFVFVLYAFYGYIVADDDKNLDVHKKMKRGGTYALGTSVRLGENRRIGIFGVGVLLLIFTMCGAIGFGVEGLPLLVRYIIAIAGLVVTTNITLVGGAAIYRTLQGYLK